MRVFGSVARGDAGTSSDLDLLVDLGDRPSLLKQAALQGDLEDLLGCAVHVTTTTGLDYAGADVREEIEREPVPL